MIDLPPSTAASEPTDGGRVALRILDLVQPKIMHARFLDRLDDVDPSLGDTAGATEPLRAIVRVEQAVRRRVA